MPRILIVEDKDSLRTALEEMLKGEGLQVTGIGDGAKAVEKLKEIEKKLEDLLAQLREEERERLESLAHRARSQPLVARRAKMRLQHSFLRGQRLCTPPCAKTAEDLQPMPGWSDQPPPLQRLDVAGGVTNNSPFQVARDYLSNHKS